MLTVAVDFDGVVHRYSRGWLDGTIYDKPVSGAKISLGALMERYAVYIHTSRDPQTVAEWIYYEMGIPTQVSMKVPPDSEPLEFWNEQGILLVTNRKLPAIAYIDDRAIFFENWGQALSDLAKFDPEIRTT